MRNYVDFQFPLLLPFLPLFNEFRVEYSPTTTNPLRSLVVMIDASRDVEALDHYGTNRFKEAGSPSCMFGFWIASISVSRASEERRDRGL